MPSAPRSRTYLALEVLLEALHLLLQLFLVPVVLFQGLELLLAELRLELRVLLPQLARDLVLQHLSVSE